MLYTLSLYSAVCQFISIKLGGKKHVQYFHVFLLLISIFLFQHKELVSEFFCKKVTEF